MVILLLGMIAVQTGCSLIDDDLTNCGFDYKFVYKMHLKVNVNLELNQTLDAETDQVAAEAVRRKLSNVFTGMAHDVDFAFYSTDPDSLVGHEYRIIDDTTTTVTIYMPVDNYTHVAVANIENNAVVQHLGKNRSTTYLEHQTGDTALSHNTGIFTARMPIQVQDTADQVFDVYMYMANSAVVLVVDTTGTGINGINACVRGVNDGFAIADSIFYASSNVPVLMEQVPLPAAAGMRGKERQRKADTSYNRMVFTTVCFPSADTATGEEGIWQVVVHVNTTDGKVVETKLLIDTPLEAGDLRVIKSELQPDGTIAVVGTTDVGAKVTLDWNPGLETDIPL